MSVKSFTRSFAGGEIAPLLTGRLDLAKNQTGLAKCLNFIVTPQGPIENRPGFQYVLQAKGACVLIPFVYNSEQSFALEFGNGYIRFHTQGSTLLEASKPIVSITQASPGVLEVTGHGYTAGQWLFLGTVAGMAELSSRWAIVATVPDADHFTLTDLWGTAIDTSALAAYTGGGTAARVYEIASPYAAADLFDLHYVQSADVLTIVHQGYAPRELRRLGATNWTLTSITFGSTIATPAVPTVATGGPGGPGGGTASDHTYVVTALVDTTLEETLPSTASAGAVAHIDLSVAGNFVDITPATVAGAVRYNIYKIKGTAGLGGYIGQSDGSTFRDDNIEPDFSKTPPNIINPFTTDWPRAVSYYEQRRCFAGTAALPQTIWTTRSATEKNLSYSIPTQDDDAITARIVAREANTVRHLVPLSDLIALTSGGVWRIASADGGALTPATFMVKPQSYVGASNVQPVVTGEAVLYAQDRGSHIREITYKWERQGLVSDDVSVLAPHLFDYAAVVQMAFSRNPYQVLWGVRDDGVLLGLSYQPEHEVRAWHQHDTVGLFKSVCAIPEGDEDGVYVRVEREINGQTVQYIERMHTRQFSDVADAFFVDAGATYSGAAATVITGLHHLEGEQVAVLANGGVHPDCTVTGGAITLDYESTTVHVGLAYNADAQTLPLAVEALPAFGQGVPKNINEVSLRVFNSSQILAGPTFDKLAPYVQRSVTDPYGSPPSLKTGIAQIKLSPQWQQDGALCVRQSAPLPLTILAMTLETATGG